MVSGLRETTAVKERLITAPFTPAAVVLEYERTVPMI